MEFPIFQDNAGSYRWTIIADDGATLATSRGFASRREAEQAAQRVIDSAAFIRFEPDRDEDGPCQPLDPPRDPSRS
jgi:uncharacterized protein YegP (UPF0339 family)